MELSIVVPTYNERGNIPRLVAGFFRELYKNKIGGELIIVDDNSPDGTGRIANGLKKTYADLKIIHRKGKLGLSSAVIDGWKISKGKIIGVMDADLSHPIEKIHELFYTICQKGFDMAIGSRYVAGGKIKGWNFGRLFCSRASTYAAKIFTRVKDPMSGFFMIKKDKLKIDNLDSKGFKILLEVLIKTPGLRIKELPITFINRIEGNSKADLREIRYYLSNLLGYAQVKYPSIYQFIQFSIVGFVGTIINLFFLYSLTEFFGVYYLLSAIISFMLAVVNNYSLNKVWTFKENLNYKIKRKFLQFLTISVISLGFNLIILFILTEFFGVYYLISQVFAIVLSLGINYMGNKIWTFKNGN